MSIEEKVKWIVIPCGTAENPRRFSVVVVPRIESADSDDTTDLTVGRLQRFKSWTSLLSTVAFQLRVHRGTQVQVCKPLPITLHPKVARTPELWGVFPEDLHVEAVTPAAVKTQEERELQVLSPPSNEILKFTQRLYGSALATSLDGAEVIDRVQIEDLSRDLLAPGVEGDWEDQAGDWLKPCESWKQLLDRYQGIRPSRISQELGIDSVRTSESTIGNAIKQLWLFHSRPPLPIFPRIEERALRVSSERKSVDFAKEDLTELGEADADRVLGPPSNAGYLLPNAVALERGLSLRGEVGRSRHFGFTNPDAGSAYTVETVPGERLGARGERIAVHPGEYLELCLEDGSWALARQRVRLSAKHSGARLYGDPARATSAVQELSFVLPEAGEISIGFEVTIRNPGSRASKESPQAGSVVVHSSLPIRDTLDPSESGVAGTPVWPGSPLPPPAKPAHSHALGAGESRQYRYSGSEWVADQENRPDFHSTLASLRNFPAVLRRLGLILDFDIPDVDVEGAALNLGRRGEVRLEVLDQAGNDFSHSSCPWTAFEVHPRESLFLPRPLYGGPESSEARQSNYYQGLLVNRAGEGRFSVIQLDTDGAGMKLGMAALRGEAAKAIQVSTAVSSQPRGIAEPASDLPALGQIGFSVCDDRLEADVAASKLRGDELRRSTEATTERPQDGSVLFAEDLVQGYRVDVRRISDGGAGEWRSLCCRIGTYRFENMKELDFTFTDEGFLSQVADQVSDAGSKIDGLRVSRCLFRWDGWSLVAERPGTPVGEDGRDLRSGDPSARSGAKSRVVASFVPAPESLERLRFGESYELRLRAVDLAGNSLDLKQAGQVSGTDKVRTSFKTGAHTRIQPITAPHLLPRQEPGSGESNDQLVIRTYDRDDADSKEWFILPPQATPEFAELHGMFDHLTSEESYRLLCEFDGELPKWELLSTGPKSKGFSRDWLRRHESRFRGLRLPYLPDPMACSAVFRSSKTGEKLGKLAFWAESERPRGPENVNVPTIAVSGGRSGFRAWGERMEVSLAPGRATVLEVGSAPCEEGARKLTLLNWGGTDWKDGVDERLSSVIHSKDRQSFQKRALASCTEAALGLLTPRRPITIIHAVQRPLIPSGHKQISFVSDPIYRFENPVDVGSNLGETTATIKGGIRIDRPSTAKLDFLAEWDDPVDDPLLPDWYEAHRAGAAFETKVEPRVEDLVELQERQGCIFGGSEEATCEAGRDVFAFEGVQKFEDTKHRIVTYRAVATSRYVEFFPESMREGSSLDPETQREQAKELVKRNFTRISEPCTFHVPAKARPAPPEPYYIVPTFAFEERREKRQVTVTRKGRGLRIYLKRGWFSSGPGEMLAVVCAQDQWATALPESVSQYVTEWGLDPVWGNDGASLPPRPLLSNFPTAAKHVGGLLTTVKAGLASGERPNGADREIEVAIAAFPVALDKDKDLLFADVEIDMGDFSAYYPFIRLGLARYQQFALTSAELSPIVRAEFVQVTPDRVATVTERRDGCLDIAVVGAEPGEGKQSSLLASGSYWEAYWETRQGGIGTLGKEAAAVLAWSPGRAGEAKWLGATREPRHPRISGLRLVERWSREAGLEASHRESSWMQDATVSAVISVPL